MNIVIFGANGQTGRLLTRTALPSGHRVVAATRRPDDFPLSESGLTVAAVDVRDAAAVTEVVHRADVVLSTLGVSFTREPVDTYSVGTGNIVAAMSGSGSRRLVVVSSTAAYPMRRSRSPLALRLFEPIIKRTIGKTVYEDMRRMESIVRGSAPGLDDRAAFGTVRPTRPHRLPRRRRRSRRRVHCADRSGPLPTGRGQRRGDGRQNRGRLDHRTHTDGVANDPPGGSRKARRSPDRGRSLALAAAKPRFPTTSTSLRKDQP